MDILKEQKNNDNKTKKVVLNLLITSIVCFIVILLILMILPEQKSSVEYSILINGEKISTKDLDVRQLEDGKIYVSLKLLCNKVGYQYFRGEYEKAGEDNDKGYIDNGMCVVQLFADSKKIYKTEENSNTDYQQYKLENNILNINNSLYICLDDLNIGLNLVNNYYTENNQTIIQTVQYIIEQNKKEFEEAGLTISNNSENNRAMSYGYIVVGKNNKYGVINLVGEELIGIKYNSITFCENIDSFIVSNSDNKYGIITPESKEQVPLQYDGIEVINYEPLLYKVEKLDKYGVMTKKGNIINKIQYDSIGYPEDKNRGIKQTLFIPQLNENIPESIVVCADDKYGLIELETGEEIIECKLKGIYSANDDMDTYYIVETETEQAFLQNYIESLNRITVNMHN